MLPGARQAIPQGGGKAKGARRGRMVLGHRRTGSRTRQRRFVSSPADRHLRAVSDEPDPLGSLRGAVRAAAHAPDLAAALRAVAAGLAAATNAQTAVIVAADGNGGHVEGRGGPLTARQALGGLLRSESARDDDVLIQYLGLTTSFGRGAPSGAILVVLPGMDTDGARVLTPVVESFAELAELCVVAAHRQRAAEDRSRHDELTHCLTRGAIECALDDELDRSGRTAAPFSLASLAIDGFKRTDDKEGHLRGDVVLGAVGAALVAAARSTDFVGRFGGDEFLVVMPGTDAGSAAAACARLAASVGAAAAASELDGVQLSYGTATWTAGVAARTLIAEADGAMFAHKRSRAG
jgi:diguanylate cyclase (GGDEF)-like protein